MVKSSAAAESTGRYPNKDNPATKTSARIVVSCNES
jgi:hypothetical protein